MGRGRAPCCEKVGLNKGSWTPVEDMRLVSYIQKFGHGNWRSLPKRAGLLRCGKSCRLRWINYLRPDIKRGNFTKEEEDTIINLHSLLGNKWSKIASYLPGRTDNEIKNVWNTHLKKRLIKPTSSSSSSNSSSDHSPSPSPSPSSSSSLPSSSSSDQSEAKSSNNNGQEVHQEVKVDDYDINIEELIIFDEMLDIFPIENKTTMTTTTTTIATSSSSSSCSLNCEYNQNESENESKKWLAYLEKELDLCECEDTTTITTTTNNNNYNNYNKQEYEKKEIVDYMESEHDDPVLSYFQRGPSSPQNFLLDFPSLDSIPSTSNGFLL